MITLSVDLSFNPDCCTSSDSAPPLLIVLGYKNGLQVWSIAVSKNATLCASVGVVSIINIAQLAVLGLTGWLRVHLQVQCGRAQSGSLSDIIMY